MSNKKKKIILVADDVKLFQFFVKQTLTSEDYELIFVQKGRQALDMVMKKDVDLLILDMELPDMNGLEVLRNIRKITQDMQSVVQLKDLPVIMVTAYPKEDVRKEAEKLGVVSFLAKPIKRKELRRIVREVFEDNSHKYGKKKLILCVDSEPRVQKFYEGTLSGELWDVITASNGIEALESIEFNKPDLIITELNLPEMNGVEFLQAVKESNHNIPVIVVSSVSEKEGMEKLNGIEIKKYLSKPFHLDELRRSIEDIFKNTGKESLKSG